MQLIVEMKHDINISINYHDYYNKKNYYMYEWYDHYTLKLSVMKYDKYRKKTHLKYFHFILLNIHVKDILARICSREYIYLTLYYN